MASGSSSSETTKKQDNTKTTEEMLIRLESSSHVGALCKKFEELFEKETMTDIVLVTEEGQIIHAHKIILASGSNYFKNIIEKTSKIPSVQNSNSPLVICLADIKHDHLLPLIKYIYTGRVDIPQNELKLLVKTAFHLKISGLYEEEEEIAGISTSSNEQNKSDFPGSSADYDGLGSDDDDGIGLEAFIKEDQLEDADMDEEFEGNSTFFDHEANESASEGSFFVRNTDYQLPVSVSVGISRTNKTSAIINQVTSRSHTKPKGTNDQDSYPYFCEQCQKGYTCSKSLWRHRKYTCKYNTSANKVTFVCKICSKVFSRSDNLKRHSLVAHNIPGSNYDANS